MTLRARAAPSSHISARCTTFVRELCKNISGRVGMDSVRRGETGQIEAEAWASTAAASGSEPSESDLADDSSDAEGELGGSCSTEAEATALEGKKEARSDNAGGGKVTGKSGSGDEDPRAIGCSGRKPRRICWTMLLWSWSIGPTSSLE